MALTTNKTLNLSESEISTKPETKEEEILGSVTQEVSTSNKRFSLPLRSSARVSKKMKLDQLNVVPVVVPEKKEVKIEEPKVQEPQKTDVIPRRVLELWSHEDKNAFFEALNDCGKDFDAITAHMNNRGKKKSINQIISKNRDQARHFYYRTWHKISQHLNFPPEVKKAVREQYGLINFGEFRKKVAFISEKNALKLNELIYSGATQIRIKGKTMRIKTPVCRALKRLNQFKESSDLKLPNRITLELKPRNNETWNYVQSIAMNPRIRITLPLQQQLSVVITSLDKKWQMPYTKFMDNKPITSVDNCSNINEERLLRIAPRKNINIVLPTIRTGEFVTSSRISLLSYEENFGTEKDAVAENLRKIQAVTNKYVKPPRQRGRVHVEEEKVKQQVETENQSNSVPNDTTIDENEFVSSAINEILSLTREMDQDNVEEPDWTGSTSNKCEFEEEQKVTTKEKTDEVIEKIRSGWTIENIDTLRVGDLYLMFGSESKLQLDYWWERKENILQPSTNEGLTSNQSHISETLKKLIMIAKSYSHEEKSPVESKKKCNCGDGETSKPRRVIKKTTKKNSNNDANKTAVSEMPPPKNSYSNKAVSASPRVSVPTTTTTIVPFIDPLTSFKEQLSSKFYRKRNNVTGTKTYVQMVPQVKPQVIQRIVEPEPVTRLTPLHVDDLDMDSASMIGDDDVKIENNFSHNSPLTELPSLSSGPENHRTGSSNRIRDMDSLLHDDDSRSSCSTITRFLKKLPSIASCSTSLGSEDNINNILSNESETTTNGNCNASLNELLSNEQPALNFSESNAQLGNIDVLLQDEDSKSSCSTITRFLRKLPDLTSPAVKDCLPNTTTIIPDGITTPILTSGNSLGRGSPTWCMSENSNFSIGSILRQIEPEKPKNSNYVERGDDDSNFTVTDVETQFQRLINESSIDYTEKFANLAAQIASENDNKNSN